MKLERLEQLKSINTKNTIVNQVLEQLPKKYFYNKYEIKVNVAFVLFSILGNTELHTEMEREDIDWLVFIDENIHLIDELEDNEDYREILEEINRGIEYKLKYGNSLIGILDGFMSNINTDEIEKALSSLLENYTTENIENTEIEQ